MPTSTILSVRVSPDEKTMIQHAAAEARSTVAEFMRRKAVEGAELELMERRVVQIDPDQWATFETMLDAPATDNTALQELSQRTPSWER